MFVSDNWKYTFLTHYHYCHLYTTASVRMNNVIVKMLVDPPCSALGLSSIIFPLGTRSHLARHKYYCTAAKAIICPFFLFIKCKKVELTYRIVRIDVLIYQCSGLDLDASIIRSCLEVGDLSLYLLERSRSNYCIDRAFELLVPAPAALY